MANAPSATLCNWAVNTRYQDLPAEVRAESLTLLYDQIGCMLAAARLPTCQPVVDLVQKMGGSGECSIIGHPYRTTVTYAALANGTIGHGNEVNSTGEHGTGQFSAVVIPTALAVGQYVGASGREFCRAVVLGSEVAGRFVYLLGKHRKRPQFAGAVGLTMGAAVCAGTLLGLDADRMRNALGLAAGHASGLSSYHDEELHHAKSFAHGKAAESGTLAALLAGEGYHGPEEPLAVENGYFDAFLGFRDAAAELLEGLGENYVMKHIAYKRYPVGGPVQTPLYGLLQIIRENRLSADEMEQIEVSLERNAHHVVTSNRNQAINIETVLSLAAVHGELTFSHVHDPRYLEDPRYKAFRERVRFSIVPRSGPSTTSDRLNMGLTVRTSSGKELSMQLRYPLMTEEEIRKKFHALAGLRLNADQVAALERRLKGFESEQNVGPVIRELEIPYS